MRDERHTVAEEAQLVVFRMGSEEFGVPIQRVQEIIKVPEITHLPNTADYIEGVINLRGDVLPVINLRTRFGLPNQEHNAETRIIVVELPVGRVGLVVDAVTEVLRIPQDAIEPAPKVTGLRTELLAGVGKLDDRLLVLLELDQLLSTDDKIRFEEIAVSQATASGTGQ